MPLCDPCRLIGDSLKYKTLVRQALGGALVKLTEGLSSRSRLELVLNTWGLNVSDGVINFNSKRTHQE